MRRAPACLLGLLLCAALFASGCMAQVDINDKALVIGVGLDEAAAPATDRVTIQYLVPSGQAGAGLIGGGQSASSFQSVTLTAPGVDVTDALRRLRAETDRYISLGNVGDIVLGASLARRGVDAPLNYFLRDGEVAEATEVVVARGGASSLLRVKSPTSNEGSARPLFEYLRLAERTYLPTAPNVLWRFLGALDSRVRSSYAPVFEPSTQGQPFRYAGVALFLDGRMVGALDARASVPVDWLVKKDGYPDALVRLPGTPGPVALYVTQVRKRITVLGPSAVALDLGFTTGVREGNILVDDSAVAPLERQASRQIGAQVRGVLDTLQRDGTDILGIGDRFFPRYPQDAADWPATFSRLRLRLTVSVLVSSGGRQT